VVAVVWAWGPPVPEEARHLPRRWYPPPVPRIVLPGWPGATAEGCGIAESKRNLCTVCPARRQVQPS
jgi:hypothetical protein